MTNNVQPIEYSEPVDLEALIRSYEPDGERGPFSISSCPKHLTWSVESLSDRAGISLVRAYAGLLERGMHEIWRCPGARDLQRAREVIVARGDQDEMRWIDTWEFDVPTADTGKSTPQMRLSVEGILTPLGKLARVLGFNKSQTAILALTVMLLHDPEVPIRYHEAHCNLVRDFAEKLRVRAKKATEYAGRRVDPTGSAPPRRYSLDDIIGVRV